MPHETRFVAISDDPQVEKYINAGFPDGGCGVKIFSTVGPALVHLQDHPADVLVLDATAAPDRGWADLHALRKHWDIDTLPIIVLTANVGCDDIVQLLQAGASDFVLKPLSHGPLIDRLRAALTMRENVAKLLESERQRVMSESLATASAITATAMGKLVDQLESLMHETVPPGRQGNDDLSEVLHHTEHAVEVIDRLRQIAEMDDVPYAARKHFLEKFSQLNC